jgi:hypothetical protein
MTPQGEARERDLENLLGQFLVASFQSNKLAEMIYERFSFRGRAAREMKLLLPGGTPGRSPLMITMRIEPYADQVAKGRKDERQKGTSRIVTLMESPPLPSENSKQLKGRLEDILEGSFSWWTSQGTYNSLRLEDWTVRVSVIDSRDSKDADEMNRILDVLEAKRMGDEVASP